jgi:hypothetical protein
MYLIELDIFSGRPNPTWILSEKEETELVDRVMADTSIVMPVSATNGELGYRGYIITALSDVEEGQKLNLPSQFRIGGSFDKDKAASLWLLETSEKPDTAVDDFLRDITKESIQASPSQSPISKPVEPLGAAQSCASNYFTSSTDFSFWNGSNYVRRNNCYNFASNYRSNTFAQPGNYSGHKYSAFTCSNVSTAVIWDGWRNNCQSSRNLTMCLVIWPGRDFHFYRKLSGGVWGHKVGSDPAKNTDHAGRRITNPETCNRGPYTTFCGYYYVDNNVIRVS